jgi:hypothetical protein
VTYADVVLSGNRITCLIESKQFSDWLQQKYYSETGADCGHKVILSAISALATATKITGFERKLFNRVAENNGYYYLDLGTTANDFVRYSANGWEMSEYSPVDFSRSSRSLPLPIPSSDRNVGCNLEGFYEFIGVTEKHQSKLTDFLISCLIPSSRELTIDFWGTCGVSSSRAAEACKRIVDPFAINQLYRFPSRAKLTAHTEMSRVVLYEHFDCQDTSSDDVDDVIQIAKGEGFATGISRPQITAYTESTKRWIPDHCISVNSVKGGLFESEFDYWEDFSVIHPEVLGALLDAVCDRLAATAG